MRTHWKKIALKIGSIQSENDTLEQGGTEFAKRAMEEILGEEWIKDAVKYAMDGEIGSEIAMNCLRLISSVEAAKYAYCIYIESEKDEAVMDWGIGLLDQLLWCEIIDYNQEQERINSLFELAYNNSNGRLKDNIDFIKDYLKQRNN
ncbi:hypothetical protein ACFLRY_04205 [Bacteroidota bacterium]